MGPSMGTVLGAAKPSAQALSNPRLSVLLYRWWKKPKSSFEYGFRREEGPIFVKGKGELLTFFLKGRDKLATFP